MLPYVGSPSGGGSIRPVKSADLNVDSFLATCDLRFSLEAQPGNEVRESVGGILRGIDEETVVIC